MRSVARRSALVLLVLTVLTSASLWAGDDLYNFTTFDPPGASGSGANGINNAGVIVGSYFDQSGLHGYLYSDGVFTTLDVPGGSITDARGINNKGQVAGNYFDANFKAQGFLYSDGVFTTLDAPGTTGTQAFGINDKGEIVGNAFDAAFIRHSFLATRRPGD